MTTDSFMGVGKAALNRAYRRGFIPAVPYIPSIKVNYGDPKGRALSAKEAALLRHTFASVAVMNGMSLPIVGALLGHSKPQTTARYAHLAADPLKEAATFIGGKIGTNG